METDLPPTNPQAGEMFYNMTDQKRYIYDGIGWKEYVDPTGKNTFSYRDIYERGEHVFSWKVSLSGEVLNGLSDSERKMYRDARRRVKRYLKMKKFLNEK